MPFKILFSAALASLFIGGSLSAPIVGDHSVVQYCGYESSQDCELQIVSINQCTMLNHVDNARWTAGTNGCWLYSNADCSGEERFSIPNAMKTFLVNIPMKGNAVYCASESHSA